MSNASAYLATAPLIAGCDVSCDWIDIACWHPAEDQLREERFNNAPDGHHRLCQWLKKNEREKNGRAVRVAVEATGVYSVDLAPLAP